MPSILLQKTQGNMLYISQKLITKRFIKDALVDRKGLFSIGEGENIITSFNGTLMRWMHVATLNNDCFLNSTDLIPIANCLFVALDTNTIIVLRFI